MIEETRFHQIIKVVTLLLCLLLTYKVVTAQDTRIPEYDRHLLYTEQGGQLAYWRVETLPVRVCQSDNYGEEWNDNIQHAIAEMNVAVPSVFSDLSYCDIIINIVEKAPNDCRRSDGSIARACAEMGSPYTYPVNVYIERDHYQLAILLHELMHAYGVWFHPDRSDTVVSGYPAANWFLNSNLTQFDIDLLTYLYSRPAYTFAMQAAGNSITEQADQDYCAWVEAHGPYGVNPVLPMDAYEKYRCE